jgi:UDP-3-O-[3-hydroxymyristoyl] glucosamine N-acyltransferase
VELRLDEVVALVGGTLLAGDGETRLSGVNTLQDAGSSDLSFFGVAKYRPQFDATKAGAVLVPPNVDSGPEGVALIQVENPSLALAVLAKKAAEMTRSIEPGIRPGAHVAQSAQVDSSAAIHPGAVIEADAVVGAGSEIRSGAVVGCGVRIGSDCLLYQNATVREGCVLGDRVILQPGAVIGSDGFGYEFSAGKHQKVPQLGIVVVEDDVEIGANSCVDRARFGKTVIGEGAKIDNLVQIAHNVEVGKHCLLVAMSAIAGSVKLGDFVTIGGQAGISGHIEIASGVQLAGQSGVHQSIKEPGAYLGVPAKPIKDAMRIWRGVAKLHETTREVKALRKELDELKGD